MERSRNGTLMSLNSQDFETLESVEKLYFGERETEDNHRRTGRRGARGAAAPPKFGQLRFFRQQEKIWAKPVFKDVFMFLIIIIILKR